MNHWTVNDIPDLRGRVALVTGATRGLGLETTRALATHGAHVIMAIPRQETPDGFEMQLGTNHLGHFALTGLLVPKLVVTPGSRVVTTTSNARRTARRIDFDDLQS